jgi:hypothetical protein
VDDGRKCTMRRLCVGLAALILTASAALADGMIFAGTDALKWGDAPAALPKGMQLAVIVGDPGQSWPLCHSRQDPDGLSASGALAFDC